MRRSYHALVCARLAVFLRFVLPVLLAFASLPVTAAFAEEDGGADAADGAASASPPSATSS